MKCVICKHGETESDQTTITLNRGEATIIIEDVPAEVCQNCGEYYLSEAVTRKVMAVAEEAVDKHAEVEIVGYAA